MALTPMFHAHAWAYPHIAALRGCKQVYLGRDEPSLPLEPAQRDGVTYSRRVPTVLDRVPSERHAQVAA